jgi:thiamine-phosphate pyrophosphorylase
MYRLMVVTDRHACAGTLEDACKAALDGGADAIQLRGKDMEGGDLFRLAQRLRRLTTDADAALIINHRVDIALAADADGVHLGWRSMTPDQVRDLAGDRLKIGVSCHTPDDLKKARAAAVDYAILGPVFPTPSKEGLVETLGVSGFEEMVKGVGGSGSTLHVIGIGGITEHNAQQVREVGAYGVAVIRAILTADDPAKAAKAFIAG